MQDSGYRAAFEVAINVLTALLFFDSPTAAVEIRRWP